MATLYKSRFMATSADWSVALSLKAVDERGAALPCWPGFHYPVRV